jgi:hypothetical protein
VTEPSPRQLLYALVAGGFLVVVAVLVVGAAVTGLVPGWWTVVTGMMWVLVTVWAGVNWRRTSVVLLSAIGLFLIWTIGTLIVAR